MGDLPDHPQSSEAAPVQPGAALRSGRADAVVVLVLWAVRRAFWPLLLVGMSVAWTSGRLDEGAVAGLTSPVELLDALLSPLAGVAAAVLLRIAVAWLALAAAWPLSRWTHTRAAGPWWRSYRRLVDRWRLAQAYRSLRWTWGVRDEAIERAGTLGHRLGLAVPVSTWATVVAAVGFVVVVALQADPAPVSGASGRPVVGGS